MIHAWLLHLLQIGRVGRADTMGLAISLVSEVPEKVGSAGMGR
jgi:hypothetical protein